MIGVGWDFNNEKESVTTKPASRGDQESTVYDEYIQYLLGSEANTPKRNELISQIDSLKAGKAALENYINNLSTGSNFQLKVDELVQYDGMTPEQATAQVLQTMGLANIGSQLTNFNAQIKDLETQLSDIPEGGGEKTPSYLDQLTEYAAPYIDDLGKIKAEYQALQQEAAAGNREALTKLKALEGQYGGLLGTQDAMMSTIFNKDYKPLNLGSFQGQALGQMYPHYKKAQEIQANKQGILGDMGNLQNDIMAGINANSSFLPLADQRDLPCASVLCAVISKATLPASSSSSIQTPSQVAGVVCCAASQAAITADTPART